MINYRFHTINLKTTNPCDVVSQGFLFLYSYILSIIFHYSIQSKKISKGIFSNFELLYLDK